MASNSVEYVITLKDFFTKPLGDMVSAVDKADSKVKNFSSSVLAMGTGFLAVMGLQNVASDVLEVGASYEMLQLRFNNMTGSVEEGTRVFDRIKQDAQITPFSVESLGDATAGFMSVGDTADSARDNIMNLGNAIAFAGKSGVEFDRVALNLQQIKGKGEASAQDMKEFGTAGIQMWNALEASTGKNREEIQKLPITYDMLNKALKDANTTTGIFANGLATVAGSTKIAMSNVSDGLNNFYDDIFQLFKPAIDSSIMSIQGLISTGRELIKWMSDHAEGLKAVGAGLGVIAGAYVLVSVGASIASIQIGTVTIGLIAQSIATFGLAETWAMLNVTMSMNPFALVVIGLAALTAGVVYAWNKFEGFRGFIMGMWGVIKQFASIVSELAQAFWDLQTGDFSGLKQHLNSAFELGKGMGDAYSKGQAEGLKSFADDNKIVVDKDGKKVKKGLPVGAGGAVAKQKGTSSSVKGSEIKNITVNIGSLVDGLTVKVMEAKEIAPRIKEEITKYLLTAVNDVNVIGG